MIFQVPKMGEREAQVLAEIDTLRETLRYAVSEPRRWTGLLRRTSFARAIRGSNTIEGYVVSIEDAMAAAEDEEPLDAESDAWDAVSGYRDAMTYVMQLAEDPHFKYSADLLRSLHYMMLKHDLSKSPGRWRPGTVAVRDGRTGELMYEGPNADRVPGLVEELIVELNGDDSRHHAISMAAMAHLNLVCIHPFRDGNGRMSRCLQTLVLARRGTLASTFSSIEEYLGHNTSDYYRVLQNVGGKVWSPEKDAGAWMRFCLTAHYRQAMTLLRRTRVTEKIWGELEQIVAKARLHERTMVALYDACIGLRVRNATYRPAAEVTNQIASRDFKQLVDAGLLKPQGERKGRYYVASDRLQAIQRRAAATETKRIPDPFELLPLRT